MGRENRNDATYPWILNTPTQVQFTGALPPTNVEPENVDMVKIYRQTDFAQLDAIFASGSAIRAQDLNNNFEQLKMVIEENSCALDGGLNQIDASAPLVHLGTQPPFNPAPGQLWWNSNSVPEGGGRMYVYYPPYWIDTSIPGTETGYLTESEADIAYVSKINDDTVAGIITFVQQPVFQDGIDVTGDITVSGTVDGRDVAADGIKLDGIEEGADVSQWDDVTGGINYAGGNVGIGDPSPLRPLWVNRPSDTDEVQTAWFGSGAAGFGTGLDIGSDHSENLVILNASGDQA